MTVLLILPRSITISWVSPEQELLNGELTHFLLEIFEEDTITTSQTISIYEEVTLDFLHPFYMYRVHVSAVTVLPGPFSEELFVITLEDGKRIYFLSCTYSTQYINVIYKTIEKRCSGHMYLLHNQLK